MHELSIVQNIVETTDAYAEEHGIERVSFVTLKIGAATGIETKYVKMYFPDLIEGTRLEGAEIRVEEVAEEAFCKDCGTVFQPNNVRRSCPECGSRDLDILSGKELLIKEIGYETA